MQTKRKWFRDPRLNANLIIGGIMLLALLLFAIFSPLFIDPQNTRVGAVKANQPPSAEFLFGTDSHGRDVFSTLVLAIPATLKVGLIAGMVSVLIGLILGLLAGFFSGWIDWIVRTLSDVLIAVPVVSFLVLIIGRMEKPNIYLMAIVIAFLTWSGTARGIRSQVLTIRERSYTAVARANGESELEVLFREVLPNLLPLLMASFIAAVTAGIYSTMSLEVLGLGPKNTPTLGMMIFWAQRMSAILRGLWWSWSPPIASIAIIFIGLFLVSSGLDRFVNPSQASARLRFKKVARPKASLRPAVAPGGNRASEAVLQVKNLTVVYETDAGPVTAVDDVSFSLAPGQRMGLIGESGSGKSTLATAVLNLSRPPAHITAGQAILEGQDLYSLNEEQLRQMRLKEIVLIPQAAMNALNPVLRIGPQIKDAIQAHARSVSKRQLNEQVTAVLEKVGLQPDVAGRFPHQLSGGMKQRAIIGIAITHQPKVIIADEPTSALDVVVQYQVMETLAQLQQELNAAVLLIGHDMGLIAQFSDTIGVLYAGRLVEHGSSDDLLENPLHPYTRLLIDSLPSLDGKHELISIPGLPPELSNLPSGCTFHPRCPFAHERCYHERPLLQQFPSGRQVACHLYPEHSRLPSLKKLASLNPEAI